MKKILLVGFLLLTLIYTYEANAMATIITSKTLSIEAKAVTNKPFEIQIPNADITIEKGGSHLKIDYYFEYNYKGKSLDDKKADAIFSQCTANLSNNILTSSCSKPKSGWINSYFHITIPEGLSLSIFVNAGNIKLRNSSLHDLHIDLQSGNLSINNTQIAGAFKCLMQSGNFDFIDSKIKKEASISIGTGKINIHKPSFISKSNISLRSGKISYRYQPSKTGKIILSGRNSSVRSHIEPAKDCLVESDILKCKQDLSDIYISLLSGLINVFPAD